MFRLFFSFLLQYQTHPLLLFDLLAGYDVDAVVTDIKLNIQRDTEAEHAIGWDVILFPTPAFRRMLVVGIGTAIAQQAVGIDAIQYFLVYILDQSGIQGDLEKTGILIGLGIIKLFFIVIAGKLFDTRGRKPLILFSCAGKELATIVRDQNVFKASLRITRLDFLSQECASHCSAYR